MSLWKLSAGTASVAGVKKINTGALPTTAYIMLGGKCRNNCGFCPQARDSKAKENFLSRVNWPPFEVSDSAAGIKDAWARGDFKGVCLQVVNGEDSWPAALHALAELKDGGPIPLCVSSFFGSVQQAEKLIEAGAERVCIALDAATPEIFGRTKDGAWEERWRLLAECAAVLPGRVTTHLIVGLGETEEEMAKIIAYCIGLGVTVGLFAFTPVRGTALSDRQPPSIGHYRRIQIAHYLLKKGHGTDSIQCQGGRIVNFNVPDLHSVLADGKAFETSGCPDCNRPYYNESPRGPMFNYHRPLVSGEIQHAILEKRHRPEDRIMKWRVIDTGFAGAAANMAIDEAIMLAHAAGDAPPTLRFYGWQPAAVSIGYFQQAAKDIDLDACAAAGISVVRRLTGGRAVLHDMELTYSIVVRDAEPSIPSAIIASYGHFSAGLMAGLRLLGVNAEMSLSRHAYGQNRGNHGFSAACFDTSSSYEVTYDGRKLVGSAQVRKHGVILQHGSVLLTFSARKATAALKLSSPEARAALEKKLEMRVASLEEILKRSVTYEEVAAAVAAGFGPALGIELQKQGLTAGEEATALRLIPEKYEKDSWNLMR